MMYMWSIIGIDVYSWFVLGLVWGTSYLHNGSWTKTRCQAWALKNWQHFHLKISLTIMSEDWKRSVLQITDFIFNHLCACVCVCWEALSVSGNATVVVGSCCRAFPQMWSVSHSTLHWHIFALIVNKVDCCCSVLPGVSRIVVLVLLRHISVFSLSLLSSQRCICVQYIISPFIFRYHISTFIDSIIR